MTRWTQATKGGEYKIVGDWVLQYTIDQSAKEFIVRVRRGNSTLSYIFNLIDGVSRSYYRQEALRVLRDVKLMKGRV